MWEVREDREKSVKTCTMCWSYEGMINSPICAIILQSNLARMCLHPALSNNLIIF